MSLIKQATSVQFKRQIKGTFSRPIIAICRGEEGLQTYFLKYPRHRNELDGLLSEILCSHLARCLKLNTPDIALVKIGDHPVSEDDIIYHNRIVHGQKVFGSRKLEKVDELSQFNFVSNKYDFNRLASPIHILRIGLFDLWIGNTDRKEDNFNLFLSQTEKQNLYVFDHFEAFNKIVDNPQDRVPAEIDVYNGFLGSNYAYNMLCWVDKTILKQEIDAFLNEITKLDVGELLDDIIEYLAGEWQINDQTIRYIMCFLTSKSRIHNIEEDTYNFIKYLPSKR